MVSTRPSGLAPVLTVLSAFAFAASGLAQDPGHDPTKGEPPPAGPLPPNPGQAGKVPGENGVVPGDSGVVRGVDPVAINRNRPVPPGSWFKKIHHDFGKFVETAAERRLEASYEFTNPTDKPQKITTITPSCKCQYLKFLLGEGETEKEIVLERTTDPAQKLKDPIEVPAGGRGRLMMKFDISGGAGDRTGDIRLDTTDPAMTSILLTCSAKIEAAFTVEPKEVRLGRMGPMDKKDWKVTVRCTVRDDWKVERVAPPLPAGLVVTAMDRKTDDQGKVYYEISGSYGPKLEEGAVGGMLVFNTDDKDQSFYLQVLAEVRESVKLAPRFFSFNAYPRDNPPDREIYLWPTGADEKDVIEIEKVEIESSSIGKDAVTFDIVKPKPLANGVAAELFKIPGTQESVPEHKLWKVVVHLAKGIKRGVVRVQGNIYLKGENQVPKPFHFNGFPKG